MRELAGEEVDRIARDVVLADLEVQVRAGGAAAAPDARDRIAAWKLVRHLLQPATQVAFNELTGDLPARKSAWKAPALADNASVATFGRQLQRAKPVPKVPEWERIVTEMQVVAERMVRGEYTPAAAAGEIDRRADRLV